MLHKQMRTPPSTELLFKIWKLGIFSFNLFLFQELHPGDLKAAVEIALNKLLDPVRADFSTPEMKKLTASAYPVEKKSRLLEC